MANSKISALTSATTPLAGTEVLPIVQSGVTKQVAVSDLTAGRAISASSITNSGLTVNRVVYAGTGGLLSTNANLTYNTAVLQIGGTAPQLNVSVTSGVQDTYMYFNNTNVYNYIYFQTSGTTFGKFLAANGTGMFADFDRFIWRSNAGAEYARIDTSGNYIPKVAATGINFTANTPAAGMTSQLLNWYEEGTWTPSQGGGLTVIGAFSSTGKYTRVGRNVTVSGTVTGATSVAVTAAGIITTNLPFTVGTAGHGNATNAAVNASAAVICTSTNVTSAGAIASTGTITFSATYFV